MYIYVCVCVCLCVCARVFQYSALACKNLIHTHTSVFRLRMKLWYIDGIRSPFHHLQVTWD
jgi:hypothetical protein